MCLKGQCELFIATTDHFT